MNDLVIAVMVGFVCAIVARGIGLNSSKPSWWIFIICSVVVITEVLESTGVYS